MSDTFGKKSQAGGIPGRVCRVAYTLNNAQPVTSTIIGDQPLFYMDYEYSYEDEILDIEDISDFESELFSLKDEIESLEKFSQAFVQESEDRLENFSCNKEMFSQPYKTTRTSIKELEETLTQSRLASAYIETAKEHGVEIIHDDHTEDACYDRSSGKILINPDLRYADQILLAARELRRHWQHRQGALIHPLLFHPDNGVLVNRLQTADLMVSIIRIAWELQLSGTKEAWERVENSPMADLGRAFAREAFLDFRTLNSGEAAAAVFEAWFLSERCCQEDKNLIQEMLSDYQGYVFGEAEAEQALTPALISALGEMPYGKNYLSPHIQVLMSDPIFTEVRDRSNANFLWFIKFERSFRETEQELQTGSEPAADDVRQAALHKFEQGQNHAEQPSAEIISFLPDNQTGNDKNSTHKKTGKNGAEIIYLRRWSGDI